MPKAPELFYYAECRLNGKTALLAGPFPEERFALAVLDAVAPSTIKDTPEAEFATFGAMSVNTHIGYGRYNYILRGQGLPILADPHGPAPFQDS